ncbi:VUT family protein [Desulfovibrio sp. OttesenSCG-928-O18]|nr:VUT family protein [Desulfovibrio sp. OttesenSCG-928-O18]
MFYAFLYVASVVLVNWLFAVIPPVPLPGGEVWPPVSLIVGFIFIIRDYAQRAVGHKVLLAMFVGAGISYFMAGPEIAFASMAAFLVGELLDWAVYTYTGRPFSQRILLSSMVSTPVDTTVFLLLIGMAGPGTILIMTMSKLAGAVAVFFLVRRRERLAVGAN